MKHIDRIEQYFDECSSGTAQSIAAHFAPDATIYDTNVRPVSGRDEIGAMWVKVRERWQGARWRVDSFVGDGQTAAIEWSMTGTNPADGRSFVFRGSEHYDFTGADNLIAEIRQYWTFDPEQLDTGLVGYLR